MLLLFQQLLLMQKTTTNWQTFVLGSATASIIYCLGSMLQEFIIKSSYSNIQDDSLERMLLPNFFILIGSVVSWGLAFGLNKKFKTTPPTHNVQNQGSSSLVEAVLVFISLLSFTKAIYLTGFPLAMMFKSCSIIVSGSLNVILTGGQSQERTAKKRSLTTQILIGVGLFFFCLGGVQQKEINAIGVELLLISLLCDGILEKIEAKSESSSNITRLKKYEMVSSGVAVLSLLYSICTGQILQMMEFIINHPIALAHLLFFGFLCGVGQIIFFELSELFQQNRKNDNSAIESLCFKHQIMSLQILGILVATGAYAEEFIANQKKINFRNYYSKINKYNVCLLDDPIQINEGTIFKVQLEVPQEQAQQRGWKERYDILKLVEQIYPPHNIIQFIERENIEQIEINQPKIEDPEERRIIIEEIKSIETNKHLDEQQENFSTEQNGSTDSKE